MLSSNGLNRGPDRRGGRLIRQRPCRKRASGRA